MNEINTKALGTTQQSMLRALVRHSGYWYDGCGWVWNTHTGTKRILETLVKRGLVERKEYDWRIEYRITEGGRSWVENTPNWLVKR